VAEVLLERLAIEPANAQGRLCADIERSFGQLARVPGANLSDIVSRLIASSAATHEAIAVAILTEAPSIASMDWLWSIHRSRHAALRGGVTNATVRPYEQTFTALRAYKIARQFRARGVSVVMGLWLVYQIGWSDGLFFAAPSWTPH